MAKIAVHFGAGNIGRGFVAQFLHASGYEVLFADVSEELIGAMQRQPSYEVHEVGEGARSTPRRTRRTSSPRSRRRSSSPPPSERESCASSRR
jgi:mannitol-1-phosphate 5-dehydrogenase